MLGSADDLAGVYFTALGRQTWDQDRERRMGVITAAPGSRFGAGAEARLGGNAYLVIAGDKLSDECRSLKE